MPALRHILFPYDFSGQGRQTVRFVKALASAFGARVTLLSVVPPAFESLPAGMSAALRVGDDTADWKRALQSQLDSALIEELAGLKVERLADSGDPALRIAAFAQEHDVDLIMMPTHGLGRYRSLLVGSVTSKVLHDAKCPLWTAAHAETQLAPEVPRSMLCAVDGAPASASLAQWAAEFAASVGAKLSLLHVVGPVSDWLSLASERRLQEEAREQARSAISSMLKSAGVEAPLHVAIGNAVATVTEHARQERSDLVIIGRGSVTEAFGRLRTHVFGIVQRAPCPVLSV